MWDIRRDEWIALESENAGKLHINQKNESVFKLNWNERNATSTATGMYKQKKSIQKQKAMGEIDAWGQKTKKENNENWNLKKLKRKKNRSTV